MIAQLGHPGFNGRVRTLIEEAGNERMHLMTFVEVAKPSAFERLVILFAQWIFYLFFFGLYLISQTTAHRLVGYFEEEAVLNYTLSIDKIDVGRIANRPIPLVTRRYWTLPNDATLRDVIIVIRNDEAHHRDVNHNFASELSGLPIGSDVTPYSRHGLPPQREGRP